MQPIPKPQVLDPDRMLVNDRNDLTVDDVSSTELLDKALHESCAYAEQLWDHLAATREYLVESLPPDPREPGPNPSRGASPTGPDDENGWSRWIDTYAAVSSVLAGPHGDSGLGLSDARHAATLRRTAPNLAVMAKIASDEADTATPPHGTVADGGDTPASGAQRARLLRAAGLGVLGVLALRGLRR